MISGFNEWAASAHVIETAHFKQLQGRALGLDADDFIDQILNDPPTKEPLLPALGGLPFSLESTLEKQLAKLKEHDIKPFFVFNGLTFNGQETKLQASLKSARSVNTAWDLYGASDPERAVAEFGTACLFNVNHIYRHVQTILHRHDIDFLVAPYSACAQLATLEGTDWCDAVAGSSELLMFDVEKVIIKLDFERQEFSWVTRRTCIETLQGVSTSMFVDACLFSGSSFLPALPQLDLDPTTAKVPRIKAATDLMKRLGWNGDGVCMHYQDEPANQALNYGDAYRKSFLAIKHHVVLMPDGRLEPLNKDTAPGIIHEFIGQRLPDELYLYLSRGVIGPRVLNWRTSAEILETPPLDGGLSTAYQELVRDKLVPLRTSALSLLSFSLARFYQHKDVTLRCWFSRDESKSLNISSGGDPKPPIAGWTVRLEAIEQKAAELKRNVSSLAMAVDSLKNPEFCKLTITPKGKDYKALTAKDEVCSNAVWRFLQLRGYIAQDHTLSPTGQCLQAGYAKMPTQDLEEPIMLALELLRLNVLNASNMFPTPPYMGAPFRGSDTDKRNTLLVSRVACLGRLRHKSIGYTGPLSRHLLAYQSVIFAVRNSLRDLVEMSLCTMLMDGFVDRKVPEKELTDIAFSLPFLHDVDCALGIAVKHYLDELAAQPEPTSPEARERVKAKGVKGWFPHAVDFTDDLEQAFILWDAIYAAVSVAPNDVVSSADRKLWADVDAWLADRR